MMSDLSLSRVLTRRPVKGLTGLPGDVRLTNSIAELIDHSEVIVECSGDPIHATRVVGEALDAGLPVVTMDSEFHVTTGSHFAARGFLTEAHGDQPGVQASLHEEAVGMGFEPLVYGNMKGFLNLNPPREDMEYWSKRQGFRVNQTTSFTDGTKVQIEQALVANAFGGTIAKRGLIAARGDDFETATQQLVDAAAEMRQPIADFTVVPGQEPGVFIIATIDESQRPALEVLKMGPGPYYTLVRPYHLCGLEIPNTIRRAMRGGAPLLNNSANPTVGVAAVAKVDLRPGHHIETGVGSFFVRGEAVRFVDAPRHVPIGILADATITKPVEAGQLITVDDVDLPASAARDIALELVNANVTRLRRTTSRSQEQAALAQ